MRHHNSTGWLRSTFRRRGSQRVVAISTAGDAGKYQEAIMTDLVESFEACVMEATLKWRGEAADVGRVDAFVQAVERECARVTGKPGIAADDAAAVRVLASAAINRAQTAGRVLAYSPAGA
jgi:hypothetical protein